MGLYKTVKDDPNGGIITYFHNKETMENSDTIYMFGASGFAWTTDGWNNGDPVWHYGFTDTGDAILNTIHAYKLSAELIETGYLRSQNGASWINMDDGTFCFGSEAGTALALDDKKELNIYGKLRSLQNPNISVYIGSSQPGNYSTFRVYDSTNGGLLSMYSSLNGDINWVCDKYESYITFGEEILEIANYGRYNATRLVLEKGYEAPAYITNDKAYIGVRAGDIQMSTLSHPYVWINYYKPEYQGERPDAYKFGNGTEGGLANVFCKKIIVGRTDEWVVAAAAIDGDTAITGSCWANNYYNNSTRDMKKNIQLQETDALPLIKLLKFYSYDYDMDSSQTTDNTEPKQSHIEFGLVAEESPKEIKSKDGKAINLYEFISLTAKSVQELSKKVEEQAQEFAKLKTEVLALKQ